MKVAIIEDEHLTALRLQNLLAKYDPQIEIVVTLPSVATSIEWLKANASPDLILMDIHLEDDQCFTIFDRINLDVPIIFTTAFDEYMIKAFKVNSVDYLMKPINYEELAAALDKFKRLHSDKPTGLEQLLKSLYEPKDKDYKDRFMVSIGSRLRTIELSDINYFFSTGKVTFLVTQENQRYPIDYSLDKLSSIINPKDFFRINRQVMVRHRAVQQIHVFPKGRIKLDLNPDMKEDAMVSLDRITPFKEWLGK